jgi:hypothetical protein
LPQQLWVDFPCALVKIGYLLCSVSHCFISRLWCGP